MQDPRSLWNSMTCVNQCYPSESTPRCCRVVLQGSVHPFEEPPIKMHGHTHGSPVTLEVCTCAGVADAASLLQARHADRVCQRGCSTFLQHALGPALSTPWFFVADGDPSCCQLHSLAQLLLQPGIQWLRYSLRG